MKHFFKLLPLTLLFLLTEISYSQLPGWSCSMPLTIKNNSGTVMTNYQVPLVVNTQYLIGLNLMLPSGNDIRFGSNCSGSTTYDYWIEGYMNTDTTKIWVKVPSVSPNDSIKIMMFFGNPAASAGSTLSIFNGPNSATDSVISPNSNTISNCQRGFRFTPTEPLLVTHFGKRIPNATQRYVTLFDFNSQAIILQMQVDAGTPGSYNYNSVAQPFWLNSGQQYLLEIFNATGDMYYYGPPTTVGQHLTFGDMRYCNSCTQNTFPTTILTGQHYGVPDMWYYVKENVTPAPSVIVGSPADTVTPPAPTNLTATAGNQQILLKWNKNTQFDIRKYFVYRNSTNNPSTAVLIDSVNHPDTMYTNTGLVNGTIYYYWVKAVDGFCSRRISTVSNVANATPVIVAEKEKVPKVFALHQNYPNPFNPVTTIRYDLPKNAMVVLNVYDVTGKEIDVLVNEYMAAGFHEISFNTENIASGVYFYKITAGDFTDKKKMIVLK